jgi:hypothetical protein
MEYELDRAITQRMALEKTWRSQLELYRAPKKEGIAHVPFEGASNYTIPFAAMNVDPILARYMANVHAAENLWTLSPLNERWIDKAKPLQDYLTWMDKRILRMWDVDYRVFLEMLKLGTGIYKTSWRYEQRRKMGYDQYKRRTRLLETINQPVVDHVHLQNFYIPQESRAIDPEAQGGAPWVAERHRFRPLQLRAMARGQEPFLPNFSPTDVDEVVKWQEAAQTEHEQKVEELDELSGSMSLMRQRPIEIWEVHARFDTTGNGIEDDIVVFFHKPTMRILRATYSTMPKRPYNEIRYIRGDGFYGIGICEQADIWQEVQSRVLNFDIDKVFLSNAPMLRASEGANIMPDEQIWPGKIIFAGKDELEAFFLAAPGSFDIAQLRDWIEAAGKTRIGTTDLMHGAVGALPSRTPATTVQSLLQEGNTKFDMSIKDLRQSGLSEVGMQVLQHLQAQALDPINNPDAQDYVQLAPMILGQPEGRFVAEALTIPAEAIELGVGVALTATSGTSNKELMKQSKLALLQITSQMAPGFIQLAGLIQQGGIVGEVAKQLFVSGAELLQDTMEQFDVRNPEELVPNIQALLASASQIQGGGTISPMGQQGGILPPQGAGGF